MRKKGVTFDQIYDRHGVRIIVPEIADCYAALGVVHTLWRPIPGEFDDYIANPKENMYQSLHTAVIGPRASRWRCRSALPRCTASPRSASPRTGATRRRPRHDEAYERKIAWLRSVIDWQTQEKNDGSEFLATVKEDLFKDRVYVFTPKGDVIDLPAGSTPIDFAYQVHTEIGHRCRGARVNNQLVSLDYQLQERRPGRDHHRQARRPEPGLAQSAPGLCQDLAGARQDPPVVPPAEPRREHHRRPRAAGARAEPPGRGQHDLRAYRPAFWQGEGRRLLHDIGTGDITTVQVATRVLQIGKVEEPPKQATEELGRRRAPQKPAIAVQGIAVQGVGNLLTVLSRCCNPMPPDDIVGFVTRGRGVSIHRRECPNVSSLKDSERLIEVDWGDTEPAISRVKIRVQAYDRAGLLR